EGSPFMLHFKKHLAFISLGILLLAAPAGGQTNPSAGPKGGRPPGEQRLPEGAAFLLKPASPPRHAQDFFRAVAVSPDGRYVAVGAGYQHCPVQLWKLDGKSGTCLWQAKAGLGNNIAALAFSPDGKLLASSDESYSIRLWETTSGKQVAYF